MRFKYIKSSHADVDVFLLNVNDNINFIDYDIIPKEQVSDIEKYRFPIDRNKLLLSRSFLYSYLNKQHNMDDFTLDYNKYKKPYFRNNTNLSFSISYSGEYVVVAVSNKHQIGVDIEYRDGDLKCSEITNIIMSSPEEKYYNQLSTQEEKRDFFFDVFNTKEAIIKCFGMGLYFDVKTINILDLSEFTALGYVLKSDLFRFALGGYYKTALIIKHGSNKQ